MAEDYMEALVRATRIRLTAASEIWGNRVYKSVPLPSEGKPTRYPYIVYTFAGGGRSPLYKTDFEEILWQIRAVSNNQAEAYTARARIRELFTNADSTQVNALDGGDDWEISTWQERNGLDIDEPINSSTLYHAGMVYKVVMQEL